jgi:hypothetical protein
MQKRCHGAMGVRYPYFLKLLKVPVPEKLNKLELEDNLHNLENHKIFKGFTRTTGYQAFLFVFIIFKI